MEKKAALGQHAQKQAADLGSVLDDPHTVFANTVCCGYAELSM